MLLNLHSFAGEVPKVSPDKLPASSAVMARDCRLSSGALQPLRMQDLRHTVRGQSEPFKSIYFYQPGNKYLCFTDDTDVIPSPIADDQYGRVYISDASGVKLAQSSGITQDALGRVSIATRPLGIPAPGGTPSISGSGGSSALTLARAVVYTFVSDLGEEGPPSAPSATVTVKQDDTISVTGMTTANPSGQNITKKRLYITTVGSSGATFQFWAEVNLADATYSGAVNSLTLGEVLPSTYWTAPPSGLTGLVALSGNFMAGFKANEVWFSEPNYPHAWPVSYMLTFNYPVVALGVDGSTLIVLTTAYVYIVSAQTPDTATVSTFPDIIPCASKRSVAQSPAGVIFAGQDALYVANSSGVGKLADEYWSRPQFQALNPSTIHGSYQNGQYVFFNDYSGGWVFTIGETADSKLVRLGFYATASAATRPDDEFTLAYPDGAGGQAIATFDSDLNKLMSYCWRSRLVITGEPVNFSCLRVTTEDFEATTPVPSPPAETGGALGASMVGAYPVAGDWWTQWFAELAAQDDSLRVRVLADGDEKFSSSVAPDKVIPLPSGFKARKWQVELEGNVTVMGLMMATSAPELMYGPMMPGASV